MIVFPEEDNLHESSSMINHLICLIPELHTAVPPQRGLRSSELYKEKPKVLIWIKACTWSSVSDNFTSQSQFEAVLSVELSSV